MPRRVFWTAAIAAVMLAGCQATSPVPTPPAIEPSTAADALPSAPAGAADAPAAAVPVVEAPAADPNRGFSATDPATVQIAAGRPQLIEFYAEW